MQHRAIFLVDKLLDQVAAVRSRLYDPRNFEYHVVRVWLGDYGKCQVDMWPGDIYPFFAPPFEEDLAGADDEAAEAFNVIQKWMVDPVREAMRIRGDPLKQEERRQRALCRIIVEHLHKRGSPFPDKRTGPQPEIMLDAYTDDDGAW